MELSNLVKVQNSFFYQLDITKVSPVDILSDHPLNTRYLLNAHYTHSTLGDVVRTLDLSLLMTETVLGKKTTWLEFLADLTEVLIEAYKIGYFNASNPSVYVDQYIVLQDYYYSVSHTSIDAPDLEDNPSQLWRTPDLAIRKTTLGEVEASNVDLKKCLCAVQGFISYPVVFNETLYVRDVVPLMYDTTPLKWPNISLLDFSTFKDVKFIPFSSCTRTFSNKKDTTESNLYRGMQLTLPNIDLTNKTVFGVFCHSLILPGQMSVLTKNTIEIYPHRSPLEYNTLRMLQCSQQYNASTMVVDTRNTDPSVNNVASWTGESYINEVCMDENHYGAFFIVVDTPDTFVEVDEVIPESTQHILCDVSDVWGILVNNRNNGITDYVAEPYNNYTMVYTTPTPNLYPLDTNSLKDYTAMEKFTCNHNANESIYPKIEDVNNTSYSFIHIVGSYKE